MRKVGIDDIALLSEIAEKIDLQFPDVTGKTEKQVGAELIMTLFKRMHKAKSEIAQLISNITGKNAFEMSVSEITASLKEIFMQEGLMSFFK